MVERNPLRCVQAWAMIISQPVLARAPNHGAPACGRASWRLLVSQTTTR